MREGQLKQKAKVIWLCGLSGSGKSTLADTLSTQLFKLGYKSTCLDGDNTRLGLNKGLGFTDAERNENLRRVAEVSKLMLDSGLIVLCSFITPMQDQREMIESIIGKENLVLVYVDCSVKVCEERDVKGLYKKARNGEIANFTGVSAPFEEPNHPFVKISTEDFNLEESTQQLLNAITPLIQFTA